MDNHNKSPEVGDYFERVKPDTDTDNVVIINRVYTPNQVSVSDLNESIDSEVHLSKRKDGNCRKWGYRKIIKDGKELNIVYRYMGINKRNVVLD